MYFVSKMLKKENIFNLLLDASTDLLNWNNNNVLPPKNVCVQEKVRKEYFLPDLLHFPEYFWHNMILKSE